MPNLKERVRIEEERLQNFLELSYLANERLKQDLKGMIINQLKIPPEDKEPMKYVVEESISIFITSLSNFFPKSETLQKVAERKIEYNKDKREMDKIIKNAMERLIRLMPKLSTEMLFEWLEYIYKEHRTHDQKIGGL